MRGSLLAVLAITSIVLIGSGVAKRAISFELNPQCPSGLDCAKAGLESDPNSANSVLYFVGRSTDGAQLNQTVHIVFSTVGGPSVLMLLTDQRARITIDWPTFLNGSRRARSVMVRDGKVLHAVGVMFTRIWRFNDQNDTANVDSAWPANAIEGIPLEKLLWKSVIMQNETGLTAVLTSSGDGVDAKLMGMNGTIQISVEFYDATGRSDKLPRLPHSDIGCQLDVELINIETGNMSQPRFAVETAAISLAAMNNESAANAYGLMEESNIDDEYTPGVFRTYYLSMPGEDGFLMWKPVAYRKPERSLDSFTRAKHGNVNQVSNTTSMELLSMNNFLSAYFDDSFSKHAVAFNVTLGLQKDKFYTNYRYIVWSLSVGWGQKPPESLSTVVIVVLIASLALPALALFVGVPYLIIRKRRSALPYEDLIAST